MKSINEETFCAAASLAFVVLVLVCVICVIAGAIKAAVIIFVPAMFCALVSTALDNEYEVVEYYYEEELD